MRDEANNPYRVSNSPAIQESTFPADNLNRANAHWLQVLIVFGAFQIFCGALELLIGIILAAFGAIFRLQGNAVFGANPNMTQEAARQAEFFMTLTLLLIASAMILIAVLRIISGVQTIRFKGRTLTFVSLFVGLGGILSVYCLVTAIGMLIFGMVVLFRGPVVSAYRLRSGGMSPSEIRAFAAAQKVS
jgi:hypothetical protein